MSSQHHTPHPFLGELTSPEVNERLSDLDLAIEEVIATTPAGASTTLSAQALLGQPDLAVVDGSPFVVGQAVFIGHAGGSSESGTIAAIAGNTLTLAANLANTYPAGTPVTSSPIELVKARGPYTSLSARLDAALPLNVRDFGAKVDNVADDRAAIQAALDAAGAADGGTVLIPAGTCRITAKLVVPMGVFLVGVSNRGSRIRLDSLTDHAIEFLGASPENKIRQCGVRNLWLQGPGKASGGTGAGIHVKWGSVGLVFDNVAINEFGWHGVFVEDSYTATWSDCMFIDNGGDGWAGETNINHTLFTRCMSILNDGRGYSISGGATAIFVNCDAEGNVSHGFDLRYVHVGMLLGCHMESNGQNGDDSNVYLHFKDVAGQPSAMVSIRGCLLQGTNTTKHGVTVDGANHTEIVDNWFGAHVTAHINVTANAARTKIGSNQYSAGIPELTNASNSTLEFGLDTATARIYRIAPGLLLAPGAAPLLLSNGMIWYDSASDTFKVRQGGVTKTITTS